MTEGQLRYQTLVENKRHNLEMERLGSVEAETRKVEAATRVRAQDLAETKWPVEEFVMKSDADSRSWAAAGTYTASIGSTVKNIGSFLFGDVFKAAAGLIG